MKYISVLILLLTFPMFSISQCQEAENTKVLLVGDSWAFFMGVDGTIDNVMKDWGHSGNKFLTNLVLAQNGAKTHHFFQQEKKDEIADKLMNTPTIKWVHLSLAGNDMLGNWKSQSFTQAQTDSLLLDVIEKLDSVVQFIKGVKPDIQIVLSGYAYPNFDEVINGFLIPSQHPFYSNWDNMEKPSNQAINQQLNAFTDLVTDFYANDERVHFTPATGITQYTYGQESPLGVSPFGTYPQYSVALPYGNPMYPSPKNSMRDYGVTKDCFHLSKRGFEGLIGYTTQKYYHKAMMSDQYFIAENHLYNGSVDESGAVHSELYLGNLNNKNFKSILTFETQNNLSFVPSGASLFVHLKNVEGENPIDDQLMIGINDEFYGVNAVIESEDYDAADKANGTACVFGSNKKGVWARLDLPQELLAYITADNLTQFKLSVPLGTEAFVELSGVDDPDFAPVLDITYSDEVITPSSIEKQEWSTMISLYPNPTSTRVNIDMDETAFKAAEIYSLDGKLIHSSNVQSIDVDLLSPGTYMIAIVTKYGVERRKFVKQ